MPVVDQEHPHYPQRVGAAGVFCSVFSLKTDHVSTLSDDVLADSLYGEYARMVLVATASCAALASAVRIGTDPSAAMLVAGNILLLGALVTARLAGLLRGLLLAAFACSLAWMTAHSATENAWLSPIPFFSPAILLASLGALVIWDLSRAIRNHSSARSYRVWGFAAALCSMMLYMVIVPSIDAFLEQFRERPASYTIEELTLLVPRERIKVA